MVFKCTISRILSLLIFISVVFFSCEKEEIYENEIESTNEIVVDSTYTDEALLKVLEEELSYINLEQKGYAVDISGMDVQKENPKKVYAHYMPWFQSKDFDGYWGQHWTMTNQNPDNIDQDGRREIASYYYPSIGPYSSKDPDLHEYHFLMMKLSGIDGVIFDWYGSRDLHDYALIKESTESFIEVLEDLGMDFSIMYEDRVAVQAVEQSLSPSVVEAVQEDFNYIRNTYFSSPRYMQFNGKNSLFIFGPEYVNTPNEWDAIFQIFDEAERPDFLSIWATQDRVGSNGAGEFLWVAPDHLLAHEYYYQTYDGENMITVGSSYPGFHSFYTEGGWSDGAHEWMIGMNQGQTFEETLSYTHHEQSDFIQLITWNDFGEGTMIEPTQEFGFMYLQMLQQYTGVSHTVEDLQIAFDLYQARKQHQNNMEVQLYLDRTYKYVKALKLNRARQIIDAIDRFY